MDNTTKRVADALGKSIGSTIAEGMPEERRREWADVCSKILRQQAVVTAGSTASRSATRDATFDRAKGEILWFNDQKGFGFIASPDLDDDAYFHISEWEFDKRRPGDGDIVYFQPQQQDQGLAATNVHLSQGGDSQ